MWNEMIFNHIFNKYGMDATIEYCKLHSEGCQMMYDILNNEKKHTYESYADYGYDAYWWKNKGEELKKQKDESTLRTTPQNY